MFLNKINQSVPPYLQKRLDDDQQWLIHKWLSIRKRKEEIRSFSVNAVSDILQCIDINTDIPHGTLPFVFRASVNTSLFNSNLPIFNPAPSANTNITNSNLSFLNNKKSRYLLFFFIRSNWFNVIIWNTNNFEKLTSPSGSIIWPIKSSKLSPFEEVINICNKRFDLNLNYFLNNSYFYVHYPRYSLFGNSLNQQCSFMKKFFGRLLDFINDKIEFLDHYYIKYPPTTHTIFELSWFGLHVFIPCRDQVLHRFIPSLGLDQALCSFLGHSDISDSLTNVLQEMLIAETDQAAYSIGKTNYQDTLDFNSLLLSIEKYLTLYDGRVPKHECIRFEGWFNCRLFRISMEKIGYTQIRNSVPSEMNILDPWVDFIMQRNSV